MLNNYMPFGLSIIEVGIPLLILCFLFGYIYEELRAKVWRHKKIGKIIPFRGYGIDTPETWKFKYPKSIGRNQSPININPDCCIITSGCPLVFNCKYFTIPKTLQIMNDGYGVLIAACFDQEFPAVSGGPLKCNYRFNSAQFKWGTTDNEGSEHTLDSHRYAMELQLMHIKGNKTYENLDCAVKKGAVLFISYFFQITPMDNPYLLPITTALECIQHPNSSIPLEAFPLCWLFQPFKSKYYYYQGSITCPPCTEGSKWILQSEPLGISSNQIKEFRKLQAIDGIMRQNTRPVQKINSREIYFYE